MTAKTRKKSPKLGHDPLAWMSEPEAVETAAKDEEMNESHASSDTQTAVAQEPVATVQPDAPGNVAPIDGAADTAVIDLPASFSIAQAADIATIMREQLATEQSNIEIHGDKVESIDAAAVQLLASFFKEGESMHKNIRLVSCSPKIEAIVDLLNIRFALKLE